VNGVKIELGLWARPFEFKNNIFPGNQGRQYSHLHLVPFRRRNCMYLLYLSISKPVTGETFSGIFTQADMRIGIKRSSLLTIRERTGFGPAGKPEMAVLSDPPPTVD
jgi:hypothetical protein